MFSGSRTRGFIVPVAVLTAILAVRVGADGGAGVPAILVPDGANSTVTIDAEGWDLPIEITIVTLSDDPVLSIPSQDADPSALARIATTIIHPETGERIEVNIVEITRSVRLLEDGSRAATWVTNDELPFTRASEIAYALDGLSVRRRVNVARSASSADDQVVGWVSGTPIVEVHVWIDAAAVRLTRPNYGIQIISRSTPKDRGPRSSGGDPTGGPGIPPGGPGSQGAGNGEVCGGDPTGGPGMPPCDGSNGRGGGR